MIDLNEELSKLNEDEVINSLEKYSSQKLSDMIISHRYFGFYPKIAEAAMSELSSRRINGDNFDYEEYIEENFNKLPKLNFKIHDMLDVANMMRGLKFK